jgi:hypothetical protein
MMSMSNIFVRHSKKLHSTEIRRKVRCPYGQNKKLYLSYCSGSVVSCSASKFLAVDVYQAILILLTAGPPITLQHYHCP